MCRANYRSHVANIFNDTFLISCLPGSDALAPSQRAGEPRGRFKDGFWIVGALVPAVVIAMVAVAVLATGQVRAESASEPEEPEEVICDGLGSLTMYVNTMTLHNLGELTKSTSSWDGQCEMSMTLIDVSSDDNPADRNKSCTVTASPGRDGYALDVTLSESGDCYTVEIDVVLEYGDTIPGGVAAAQLPESDLGSSTEISDVGPDQGGVVGQTSCNYTTEGDDPHISSSRNAVSAHGWWETPGVSWNCPTYADVTVTLRLWVCNSISGRCWWTTLNTGKKRVLAGGGSGKRATARTSCSASSPVGYRSIIDVDLVGQSDPNDVKINTVNVRCRPPGY